MYMIRAYHIRNVYDTSEIFLSHQHRLCWQVHDFQQNMLYPDTTKELRGYNKLTIKQQNIIQKKLFPNLENDPIKYQLNVHNIATLNHEELILSLQQRDLPIFEYTRTGLKFKRNKCIERLKSFLDCERCLNRHTLLIFGFCNELVKEFNVSFPVYLIQIVKSFYYIYIFADS